MPHGFVQDSITAEIEAASRAIDAAFGVLKVKGLGSKQQKKHRAEMALISLVMAKPAGTDAVLSWLAAMDSALAKLGRRSAGAVRTETLRRLQTIVARADRLWAQHEPDLRAAASAAGDKDMLVAIERRGGLVNDVQVARYDRRMKSKNKHAARKLTSKLVPEIITPVDPDGGSKSAIVLPLSGKTIELPAGAGGPRGGMSRAAKKAYRNAQDRALRAAKPVVKWTGKSEQEWLEYRKTRRSRDSQIRSYDYVLIAAREMGIEPPPYKGAGKRFVGENELYGELVTKGREIYERKSQEIRERYRQDMLNLSCGLRER